MTQARRRHQLTIDEVDPVGQPVFHVPNFAGVTAATGLETPFLILAWLGFAQLGRQAIDDCVLMREREVRATQFLPAINPLLPEIRVAKEPGPPGCPEERSGCPMPGVIVP